MNKKNIVIMIALFSIVFVVVLMFLLGEKTPVYMKPRTPEENDNNLGYLAQQYKKAKELGKEEEVKKVEDKILDSLPEKLRNAAKLAKQASFDIEFYGKIIDQDNKPISEATIQYSTIGLWNMTQGTQGEVVTDRNGIFVINAVGNKLFINMPRHPEVAETYVPAIVNGSISELPSKRLIFEAGQGVYTNSRGWGSYSMDNPFVIKVWRVSKFENVLHGNTLLGPSPDGTVYTFLKTDEYTKMISKKGINPEGHLLITCLRDPDGFQNKNGAWKVTIQAINGGIQETNDKYLFRAPADGYQESLKIEMSAKEKYGASVLENKRYYYMARNGRVFGGINVKYEPYLKKRYCGLYVDYVVNMNGSRNLAVPSQ